MSRSTSIATVLEAMVQWQRVLASLPRPPFADQELSRSHMEVLFALAHGAQDMTPSALAEHLGVTRGAVTQAVDPLVQRGLVEQVPHPSDARSKVVRLTGSAREIVTAFEANAVKAVAPHFVAVSDEELAALAATLTRTTGVVR